jgi:hypothetical protein
MPSTAFAARMQRFAEASASGLRSGLSLHPLPDDPGLRCRPSSLYTFPAYVSPGLARDCHIKMVSPTLSSSASPVSRRALKFFSSPLRLPFRHARVAGLTTAVYDRAGLPEFTRWFPDPQSAAKPGISGGLCFPFVFVLLGPHDVDRGASSRVLM